MVNLTNLAPLACAAPMGLMFWIMNRDPGSRDSHDASRSGANATRTSNRKGGSAMFKCFNRKVLVGVAVVAAGALALAPGSFASVLPLLVLAVCPLSMVFTMRGMNREKSRGNTPSSTASTSIDTDTELTRRRAEIDQLKAEHADRDRSDRRA